MHTSLTATTNPLPCAAGVVEYVEFTALAHCSDDEILEALRATQPILDNLEGFIQRHLGKRDEHWVEVVYWRDKAAATAGLEVFKFHPLSEPLFTKIRPESVVIRYAQLLV